MGNTPSAATPADLMNVDAYINDVVDKDSVESLGSTRFMKVARGRTSDGHQVLKVFIFGEETEVLKEYRDEIVRIQRTLNGSRNCCPIRKILTKGKHAILCRPYQKYTLYDRLSTRPFIVEIERLWYIYQLFQALCQCNKTGVSHGDLKSQNVLISSSNWLQITDFASYKPTFLPIDNPSSFQFYFDTSRRQTCYIAPERFLSNAEHSRAENNASRGASQYEHLRHTMDMFSVGCVVYEILCDGRAPFSYAELCAYRAMSDADAARHREALLTPVPGPFKPVLRLLLERDPGRRPSADKVLSEFSNLFPSVFESFLYNYFNIFRPKDVSASVSIEDFDTNHRMLSLEPDDVIKRLRDDCDKMIIPKLSVDAASKSAATLLISLITSNIRALKAISAKIDAMRLLLKFAAMAGPAVATERVLPFLVHLTHTETEGQVRGCAVKAIVDLLEPIQPVTLEDSMIFIDYLLPRFSLVEPREPRKCETSCQNKMFQAQDNPSDSIAQGRGGTSVLLALSANLGRIAETATRFMARGREIRGEGSTDDETSAAEAVNEAATRAQETSALYKAVTDLFVHLSTRENEIKHCLVSRDSFQKLQQFCEESREPESSTFLFEHLVTFLNTKSDWRLRAVFFDALPICLQRKSIGAKSLLQQGIHDFEDMVVVQAMRCIVTLAARDHLERTAIIGLLQDIVPFLAHPNEWIRGSVVDLLVLLDSKWTVADVHCRLLPAVNEYTKERMIRLNNKFVIMSLLNPPIPRELWRKIVELDQNTTNEFYKFLEEQVLCMQSLGTDITRASDRRFQKLMDLGLKDPVTLKKVANFRHSLKKMADFRTTSSRECSLTQYNGSIDLTGEAYTKVNRHKHVFGETVSTVFSGSIPSDPRLTKELNDMFGADAVRNGSKLMRTSVCDTEVHELLKHKNDVYRRGIGRAREYSQPSRAGTSSVKGHLVTHLHEHSKKVTRLSLQPTTEFMASSSADGTVKIWRTSSIGGKCDVARSEGNIIYNRNHSINDVGWACDGQVLCMATSDNRILWCDGSIASGNRLTSQVVLPAEDGAPQQLITRGQISYVRTHHGALYCLDYRVGASNGVLGRHEVWRREVSHGHGLITSFVVDPERENWMLLSGTNNEVMLWDLRYPLEVNYWKVGKIVPLNVWPITFRTRESRGPEVFVGFSHFGEIASYELHTGARKNVLWPSLKPPLSYTRTPEDDSYTVSTALTCSPESEYIYTGDSLGALRRWHLSDAHKCEYLSGPRRPDGEFTRPHRIVYDRAMVDGRLTFFESRVENQTRRDSRFVSSPMETMVTTTHRSAISDVCCLPDGLLASSSVDGVIKVWS